MKATRHRARPFAAMAACLALGMLIGWWLHGTGGPRPPARATEGRPSVEPMVEPIAIERPTVERPPDRTAGGGPWVERPSVTPATPRDDERPVATAGEPVIAAPPRGAELGGAIEVLQRRDLRVPVDGVNAESFTGGFTERRSGASGHTHEAVDILAPRHTPVRAVEGGTIAKLFDSKAGGLTIYQFDPGERFAYYYAHLERYAEGLHDAQRVTAGEVIGYVGTSGNAPPGTPHLHFAVFELGPDKRWWQGQALDPYLVFRQ